MVDPAVIQTALGLATAAIGTTGGLVDLAERIKALVGSGQSANPELEALVNRLSGELTATNLMNLQLSEAMKTLAREIEKEDEFKREKARYDLFQTPGGDHVLRLRDDSPNGDPPHFACWLCMQDRRTSPLREYGRLLTCHRCRTTLDFKKPEPVKRTPNRDRWL